MKKFTATFKRINWFNGGMREFTTQKEIEARTLKPAVNKARKMEQSGKSLCWWLLMDVKEA